MSKRWSCVGAVLLGALLGCGGGTAGGAAVDPAEVKGSEPLNPRLPDGRVVHLSFDSHHPECFVFAGSPAGSSGEESRETEEVPCPEAALKFKACPAGVVYRAKTGGECICVPAGGEDARRMACP
ncbi:hypothetical protein [Chondromyces apiculatus]|uniref:Lipoprotein n=1 Tax=Chondromyces apiculatus DSM 436 TaxID=1192034 RepID=A0A017T1Z6_9BACT|nr:hypothetical protein [Chondromyces apiculatus]EYF03002.1 Hypothetical protein CAP_6264 [Chondromyces apiculatus DSM 436]